MNNPLLKTELIGTGIIILLGAAFHFTFAWTGNWPPAGTFFAVNESVFEHLKLTFWPTIIYSAVTFKLLRQHTDNFMPAKAAAVFAMPLTIIILYYGYTVTTGLDSLLIDIIIFIIAVAAGQTVSYRVLKAAPLPGWLTWLSLVLIIMLAVIYAVFTYNPPQAAFFRDAHGFYGIP